MNVIDFFILKDKKSDQPDKTSNLAVNHFEGSANEMRI
jgi:hypothetical protein